MKDGERYKLVELEDFIHHLAPLIRKKKVYDKLNSDINYLKENKKEIINNIEKEQKEYDRVQAEFYSRAPIDNIEPRFYFPPHENEFTSWVNKDREAFLGLLKTCGLSWRESDAHSVHYIKRDAKSCDNCRKKALIRVTYQASGGMYSIPLCAECLITNMRKQLNKYFYKLFKIFY